MQRGQGGIASIKVNKGELLAILTKNRETHHQDFEDAVVAFRARAAEEIEKLADEVVIRGKVRGLYCHIPVPEEHTADYDRAIRMLEMDTRDELEISEETFTCLVQDEWGWRSSFLANTMSYKDDPLGVGK